MLLQWFLAAAGGSQAADVVNVDGHTITHGSGGGGATAGVRFNLDGTVDRLQGAVYTQIDVAADWVRPVDDFVDKLIQKNLIEKIQ